MSRRSATGGGCVHQRHWQQIGGYTCRPGVGGHGLLVSRPTARKRRTTTQVLGWFCLTALLRMVRATDMHVAVICQDDYLDVSCPDQEVLVFSAVNFGRTDPTTCTSSSSSSSSSPETRTNCTLPSSWDILQDKCFHQSLCTIQAAISVFGDVCPNTTKYLQVHYNCIQPESITSVCESKVADLPEPGTSGILTNPEFPLPSPADLQCQLTLAPPPGQYIVADLISSSLSINTSGGTCRDSLTLTESSTAATNSSSNTITTIQYCTDEDYSSLTHFDNQPPAPPQPVRINKLTVSYLTTSSNGSRFLLQYTVEGCKTADILIPDHSEISQYTYGQSVLITCTQGYQLESPGQGHLVCQGHTWVGDPTVCNPITCTHPGSPENGSSDPEPEEGLLLPGMSVSFSCQRGYDLVGKTTRMCQTDGSMSASSPLCNATICEPPSIIDNGKVTLSTTAAGYVALYSCKDGYILEDATTAARECLNDGKWNGSEPRCREISCPALTSIPSGQVTYSYSSQGKVAHYSCIQGFQLVGDVYRSCLADGSWSRPISTPICKRIVCRHPGTPLNGNADPGFVSDFPIGTPIEFKCDNGFTLIGNSTILCDDDGNWTSRMPFCKKISRMAVPPENDMPEVDTTTSTMPQVGSTLLEPWFGTTQVEEVSVTGNSSESTKGKPFLTTGAIAGIAVVSVVILLVIFWVIGISCWKRSHKKNQRGRSNPRVPQPSCRDDSITELVDRAFQKNKMNHRCPFRNACGDGGHVNPHVDWYAEGFSQTYSKSIKSKVHMNGKERTENGGSIADLPVTVTVVSPAEDQHTAYRISAGSSSNGSIPHLQTKHDGDEEVCENGCSTASSNGNLVPHITNNSSQLSPNNSIRSSAGGSQKSSTQL